MPQITLYLDNETESKMKEAARDEGISMSRWVAKTIRERTSNSWPESVLSLEGAWTDFPELEELREAEGKDVPREPF